MNDIISRLLSFVGLFYALTTLCGQSTGTSFFSFCPSAPVVRDHEGNTYRTVQIESQCWMAENMRCTTSPTGRSWFVNPSFSATQPEYAAYIAIPPDNRYGMLYNWAAAMDIPSYSRHKSTGKQVRGICPEGWHVPCNEDWSLLFKSLGGNGIAGEVMKTPTRQWQPHLIIQKDVMGFDAFPVGTYTENGFQNMGFQTYFWSADPFNRDQAWCCIVYDYKTDSYNYLDYKCYGHSVRCVKD